MKKWMKRKVLLTDKFVRLLLLNNNVTEIRETIIIMDY